ncbi:MAG: dihydrodipicolinate synthase family protein [Chitinophagaceae bacterium]|nr:dihydrodipicolinate synthase family protein [Chitinophagaceae bacterium]
MNTGKKYTGVIVPAVTPLTAKLHLDESAVARMLSLFYQYNISPFILGTTGESASLSLQLKKDYVLAAERNKKMGTLLYAGIGSNVLTESIEFADYCAIHAIDVVVATLPSYYPLTEKQMLKYFLQLADSIKLPLFLYNIPATTHMSLPLHIVDELSRHKNIVGIKDSERSEERMRESLKLWRGRDDFHYILGWAVKSSEALLLGADGLVPSTGNLYPDVYAGMLNAFKLGDKVKLSEMQALGDEYGALYQTERTLGESLRALKLLMKEKGLCEEYVMPPL